MGWHHEECEGKCLACLIEALVKEHYGTQGLDFLHRKVGADETAQPAAWIRFLPADEDGVIVHDNVPHPEEMTFDEEEKPQ